MAQSFNPYLPSWEYIPDGEPYVVNGRVYVYGSHDRFNGTAYCLNDYVCWSAPIHNDAGEPGLGTWRYEGVIFSARQDPRADEHSLLFAPDMAQGADGRFYLYYALHNREAMGVAVADKPEGPYAYYGVISRKDGSVVGESGADADDVRNFDPGVLVDDDGRVFLYSGFAPRRPSAETEQKMSAEQKHFNNRSLGSYCMELEADMLTVKRGPFLVFHRAGDAVGTPYEGHEFFEASSLRKVKLPGWAAPKYYFIYSSINSHELCYALSDRPDGGFQYGGVIISNGDVGLIKQDINPDDEAQNTHGIPIGSKTGRAYMGNNHGSIVEIHGQWYIFYHRQTNLHQYSRQDCAEPISIRADGSIPQVEITSCGLNTDTQGKPVPLQGFGAYEARIACNLYLPGSVMWFPFDHRLEPGNIPYITQDGPDYSPEKGGKEPQQFIANLSEGAVAGYKYFAIDNKTQPVKTLKVTLRGKAKGAVSLSPEPGGQPFATLPLSLDGDSWQEFSAPCTIPDGKTALYFTFTGEGAFDFLRFALW
jgi:hypothetical protein